MDGLYKSLGAWLKGSYLWHSSCCRCCRCCRARPQHQWKSLFQEQFSLANALIDARTGRGAGSARTFVQEVRGRSGAPPSGHFGGAFFQTCCTCLKCFATIALTNIAIFRKFIPPSSNSARDTLHCPRFLQNCCSGIRNIDFSDFSKFASFPARMVALVLKRTNFEWIWRWPPGVLYLAVCHVFLFWIRRVLFVSNVSSTHVGTRSPIPRTVGAPQNTQNRKRIALTLLSIAGIIISGAGLETLHFVDVQKSMT